MQLTGVVRASSVVYIGCRLTFAAALVAFGTWKLRKWNPGTNEPRELREEGEVEVVETLVEISEETALEDGRGGCGRLGRGQSRGCRRRRSFPDRCRSRPDGWLRGEAGGDGEPGPTTGLHVPRRTHRRIGAKRQAYRHPWTNPILWRELKTRAYGAKPLIIKGCYVLLFALGMALFFHLGQDVRKPAASTLGLIPIGLAILSLVLINAQGVTALTSERDTGALDLLLVSELSPKEFIYGKLYGVLYNSKEMIALPVLTGDRDGVVTRSVIMSGENLVLFLIDFLLLCHFAAMLGLHAAITYTSSRTAVANSLATIFFLMVGILLCAFLIVLNNQEFARQLLSFMIFIGAGSVALFGSLGAKNPSHAIALVAILTPFWTFYCIISLVNGDIMAAFLVSAGIYGFALLAMLVPAVGDFDIALGRTNAIQG